ncbi:MAG: 3'-5' exonuclease, partial [Bacteroidales bacterium]|nr:3'-5' exonuclease [Bacteroidales bacterium]
TEMLHDYSFFSVSTIDSFFQKIVRNFTRETGIQYNYEIELDTDSVINSTVDILLESCNSDPQLKKDIISLVDQKIENSSKWDFRKDLRNFLKKVIESDFRNYEKEYFEFFGDKNKISQFQSILFKSKQEFENEIKKYCESISHVLKKHNLNSQDFSGKSRSIANKLSNTYQKLKENSELEINNHFANIDVPEKWLTKAQISTEPYYSAMNELMSLAQQMKEHFELKYSDYNTAIIINKHFNYAAIINSGLKTLHQYLNDEGKFLISEIPVFLSEIATNNSSSFIYEKTGSYYENFLIDEFQDTSNIQWQSFYPLLHESLSSGTEKDINVLVGDVKQSIYAWRGGDWRLLAYRIQQIFKNYYETKNLLDNWRSGKDIVDFNNSFFTNASNILANSINSNYPEHLHSLTGDLLRNSIYNNLIQTCKKDFKSYVNITIFDKQDKKDTSAVIRNIIKQIEYLQEMNYKPGDIMILVRKNDEGSDIARQIIQYSQSAEAKPGIIYDVISSDALFVSANRAVRLIISCLRYFADKNNKLAFNEAAYIYYIQSKLHNDEEIIFSKDVFFNKLENIIKPIENIDKNISLHEIVDLIISLLELNKIDENIPFLNSFRDIIHDYCMKNPAEINNFLEYWDETGVSLNLKIPEKQNAINIISIHKAKGLAADFVFIPFCDWNMTRYNDIIWAKTDSAPYNALPVWPVSFNNKLANSLFCDDFYIHKFQQTVEAFNMMYVAFTRARKGLFISAYDQTDNTFNSIYSVLKKVISEPEFTNVSKLINNRNSESGFTEYNLGEIEKIEKINEDNKYFNSYPVYLTNKQIRIKSFFDRDKVNASSQSSIHKGIIYHKIFESITTSKDIDNAINKLFITGQIQQNEINNLSNEIKKIISSDFIKSWFDGTYKVINEAEIITKSQNIRRPDRIMISDNETIVVDYKFGFDENKKYIRQTKEYASLLEKMGYENIKTYIWYVFSNYLVKVLVDSDETEKIELE